jgi:TonB family protein
VYLTTTYGNSESVRGAIKIVSYYIYPPITLTLKNLFCLLLTLSSLSALSQINAPISDHFDKDGKRVTDPGKALYYRTIEQNDNGYLVRDYYISGKPRMIVNCLEVSPDLQMEGNYILYYENGSIEHEGEYHFNEMVGLHKWFYENGKPKKEVEYKKENTVYHHLWSENGYDELKDGQAVVLVRSDNRYDFFHEVKDFLVVDVYSVERATGDTIVTIVETQPRYPGGDGQMLKEIVSALVYPASARRIGVAGRVYVAFVIDKDGTPRNFEVIKGLTPDCDSAAVKAVSVLKRFTPAMQQTQGLDKEMRPVSSRFIVPIVFKLTEGKKRRG